MRLADETIILRLENEVLLLRPSLRVAMRLDRQYGGFQRVVNGVLEGSLSVMTDLIREGSSGSAQLLDHQTLLRNTLHRESFEKLRAPLLAFVAGLLGADPKHADEDSFGGTPISAADYYARLFEIGTGWIGWTPEQTWEATPLEIATAYTGRLDMLKAIFGSGQNPGGAPYDPRDTSVDEAGVEWLRNNSQRQAS